MSTSPRVLLVMTSHDDLGGVRATGAFASEAAHPWRLFTDAGVDVDVASVRGGCPPFYGLNADDADQEAFFAEVDLDATPALADVDLTAYDAVFFVGGHGTMWDFTGDPVASTVSALWAQGAVVAAVCHGPAALVGAVDEHGRPLVADRAVTGFSNTEEKAAGVDEIVPFLLATRLAELGGRYREAEAFTPHVVVDGRLVTGQNPASARVVAQAVLDVLQAD